jgi:predicted house-cleaning noncanonical NTP pyrophosphatase (MazG superfamily)
MSRFVGIKMSDDEYEMYRSMARIEGKNFSKWVRDKLNEAVRQEMKEVNLLNRLIKLIEEFPERLRMQIQMQMKGVSGEEFSQLASLLVYLVKLIEFQSEYTIVMEAKRKEFQARREELKKSLGVEV